EKYSTKRAPFGFSPTSVITVSLPPVSIQALPLTSALAEEINPFFQPLTDSSMFLPAGNSTSADAASTSAGRARLAPGLSVSEGIGTANRGLPLALTSKLQSVLPIEPSLST